MIETISRYILPAALSVLPAHMDGAEARAMLLAIGLQESRFLFRKQNDAGPARGFWQFERAGVFNVCRHESAREPLRLALIALRYGDVADDPRELYYAVRDNDVLAAVFARLLLFTLPKALPRQTDPAGAWAQYLEAWRPGAPHRETWDQLFSEAWARTTLINT